MSLNLRSSADALQTLHNIISPSPEQQTLGKATAAAVAASSFSHKQHVSLYSSAPSPVALEDSPRSSSRPNVRAQRRLLLEAQLTSPRPSPRDLPSPSIAASDLPCPPAALAVAGAPLEAMDGCTSSGGTNVLPAEFHPAVVLAAQAQSHAAHPFRSTEGVDFTRGLIALNLSHCPSFDAHSLKSASTLLSSIHLQTIIMDSCGIDDDGAAALASTLSCYPSLRTLNLRHNAITDAGAKRLLLAAQAHAKLHTIVCDGCRVSVRLQRTLWDLSKKKAVSEAHKSPTPQQELAPASPSGPSGVRETNRPQHCPSAGTAVRRPEAAVAAVQHVSGGATEILPYRASSFASFIASRPRRSTNRIPSCASAPVSPLARPPVGSQPGSATHVRHAPLSRLESDDDSEVINQFIQSRRCLGNFDHVTTGSPQSSSSPGNSSASCGAGIDDLLEACATMQDQAGIPVPLHFNRRTPLHEIRAFMRREQLKRAKASPATLLRDKSPAAALESVQSSSPGSLRPGSLSCRPIISKDSPLQSVQKENLEAAADAAHQQTKESPDEEQWSRICAVGVSTDDLAPSIACALMQIPFSDFDAEESALSPASLDEVARSGAQDEGHPALSQPLDHSSTHMHRGNCPPLPLSPPLSPRVMQTSSPTQAIAELVAPPLLLQATCAEPLSPRQLGALVVHEHEGKATDGLNCINDDSILWAKKVDVMIRTTLQSSPSLPD